MARTSTIPQTVVSEDISLIFEHPGQAVRVDVGVLDANGEFVVPQTYKSYMIKDADFEELMSAGPAWALNKPAGTYRNEDLWIFIDRQRGAA